MRLYGLTQTVPPASEPILLEEAKLQARIDADLTDEDGLLQAYVWAAVAQLENETGRQLLAATYVLTLDQFPACRYLELPRPPLLSVEEVEYLDIDGAPQVWDAANYTVDLAHDPGRLWLPTTGQWPTVSAEVNAVTITYIAGYGTSALSVPAPLRAALLLLTAEFYKNREMSLDRRMMTEKLPLSVERLLWPYRTAAVLVA